MYAVLLMTAGLLNILAEQFIDLPSAIRIIITSLADLDIRCAFESQSRLNHD
jgi:hypothetical protein